MCSVCSTVLKVSLLPNIYYSRSLAEVCKCSPTEFWRRRFWNSFFYASKSLLFALPSTHFSKAKRIAAPEIGISRKYSFWWMTCFLDNWIDSDWLTFCAVYTLPTYYRLYTTSTYQPITCCIFLHILQWPFFLYKKSFIYCTKRETISGTFFL